MAKFRDKLSGLNYHRLKRPLLYAWYRGEECLYVGCSMVGITRVLNDKHDIINKVDNVLETDEIKLQWCNYQTTKAVLVAAEAVLIHELQPKFNFHKHLMRDKFYNNKSLKKQKFDEIVAYFNQT